MSTSNVSRRTLLRAASGLTLGLPFLESLLPSSVFAQAVTSPKRLVAIQTYSGQVATSWYPTTVPAGYRLRNTVFGGNTGKSDGTTYLHNRLAPGSKYSIAPLSDFSSPTGISKVLGPTLNPFLSKMNLVRGLDFMVGAGHNSGGYFGNYAASTQAAAYTLPKMPTVDRVLAYSSKFYQQAPVVRALDLGTGMPSSFSFTNYGVANGPVEQVRFDLNPRDAWNRAFGAFMGPATPRANPNVSLMNSIYADYSRLKSNRRLSAADKQLLDRHLTFLGELEQKISVAPMVACSVPTAPRSIANGYPWEQVSSITDFQDSIRLMAEVAVAALRCDVTRIITFDVQKALTDASGTPRPSFHNSAGVAGDWHSFAHDLGPNNAAKTNFEAISRWVGREVFGRFVQLLDVEEGGGKTFLDNSLVVWGNELGYNHYNTDVMTLMAGSAGGALRTGNYVDYIDWDQSYANPITDWGVLIPGIPHNRLLVTILRAMGLSPADYETGGRRGYGLQQYVETPYNWPRTYDLGQIGEPLPGLWV